MYVCVYVCMYVRTYACMCVCMCVCMQKCIYERVDEWMSTCILASVFSLVCIRTHNYVYNFAVRLQILVKTTDCFVYSELQCCGDKVRGRTD